MRCTLDVILLFSGDLSSLKGDITDFLAKAETTLFSREGSTTHIQDVTVKQDRLSFKVLTEGNFRPHGALLQLKNALGKEFGKRHRLGIRTIQIKEYTIAFTLGKPPQHPFTIPFAEVTFQGTLAILRMSNLDEAFLRKNYIDRMMARVREKAAHQYYEGKAEFWNLIWRSEEKSSFWTKDPTEEMLRRGWLKQGPTKGKWFYRPQAAAILKTMETIAVKEVLQPLGFQEVIESHIVPFDIWLKTGHLEGMPSELYYVTEPATRNEEQWERFIDLTKITKEVPLEELQKNLAVPTAGICYAQCPMIYWSLKGTTLAEHTLPLLLFDRTAISGRYESGGRHGIERVDEFHRLEPIYIGTREQLLDLRERLLERYKHVFNEIMDLEWRMAQVTPWYMQQAGENGVSGEADCGTIDFEAYMPYRGDRESSEWLEFQNLSIIGDKYVKAFTIKAQKSELWSGCSGIGLERWATAFLAQKGLDPKHWPEGFRSYLPELPKGITLL
jgi:seryl-tRNA synthetase